MCVRVSPKLRVRRDVMRIIIIGKREEFQNFDKIDFSSFLALLHNRLTF